MKETQSCNENSFPWHMVDSKWNDVSWKKSLMLRPRYQEKMEESNCDEVISEEEADHLVNSVKEYPVVKMKELHNYKVGDVVRIKETGDLVVINNYLGCRSCVLYEQYCRNPDSCHVKTGCYGECKAFGGKSVHFKLVKE